LADPARQRLWERSGTYYVARPLAREGRVALMFPGEGSQYPGMLADVVMAVPAVRRWFDLVDRAFQGHARGFPPSRAVYPPPGDPTAEALIWRMDVGPESLFAASQGLLALLRDLGLDFDAVLGHSTGEWSALVAADVLPVRDDDGLVADVAALNRLYERLERERTLSRAVLLSVGGADRTTVDDALVRSDGRLALALDNCPSQVVLCGDEGAPRRRRCWVGPAPCASASRSTVPTTPRPSTTSRGTCALTWALSRSRSRSSTSTRAGRRHHSLVTPRRSETWLPSSGPIRSGSARRSSRCTATTSGSSSRLARGRT
jgi:hypothetical protein